MSFRDQGQATTVRLVRGGVFICHASEDAVAAERIVATLERADIGCWIAPRDIEAGEEYAQAILDGLEAAPAVVLVFSAATNNSPHVRRELETAVGADKRIVPVRLEDVEPSRLLRYFIGTAQWLNTVAAAPEEWHQTLVRGVRRALGEVAAEDGAAPAPARSVPVPTDRSETQIRRWQVPAAVGAAVILVAVVVGLVLTRGEDPSDPSASSTPTGSAEPSPTDSTRTTPTVTDSATSSPPPPPSEVVIEENFDEEPHAFRTDTEQFDQGSITGKVVDGEYLVTVEGIPEGNKGWFSVNFRRLSGDWSVSVAASPQPASGGCGLMIDAGSDTLTAVLRRSDGDGELMWFVDNNYDHDVLFEAADVSGRLALSRRGGHLVMAVGNNEVAQAPIGRLGRPSQAGVAVVGASSTCVFDEFLVHRRAVPPNLPVCCIASQQRFRERGRRELPLTRATAEPAGTGSARAVLVKPSRGRAGVRRRARTRARR